MDPDLSSGLSGAPFEVLYKDGLILVLNKHAGLSCTPNSRDQTCLTSWLGQLTFGKTTLPQVAHRLDRETSGCLILGRHPRALRQLGQLFQQRQIEKTYWAVVEGRFSHEAVDIDEPIDQQSAQTGVRRLYLGPDWSLLELQPRTGRTHQLRIHCAGLGHPIRGDQRYGRARARSQLMLHALKVSLPLYKRKPPLVVEAPLGIHWSDFRVGV